MDERFIRNEMLWGPAAQARLAQANKDMGFAPIRIQFKKANDKYTAQDGLAAVRRFAPEKISRIRKPKY